MRVLPHVPRVFPHNCVPPIPETWWNIENNVAISISSWPPFEPLPHVRYQIYQDELQKETKMEDEAESSHPKVTQVWKSWKCIPQSSATPRYVVNSTRVGEHTQFMKDHALIKNFIELWPSEWDLIIWINIRWKPNGHYELQLGSKEFFTTIFYNLEDKDRILENGPYSLTMLVFIYGSIWIDSS